MRIRRRWPARARIAALIVAIVALLAGCATQPDAATLVLRVGPPNDAATVAAAADVVRARLASLGVSGAVAIDGPLLRLSVPPAQPGSTLVASLTDPARLRLLAVPDGEPPPEGGVLDPSWETVVEATGAIPAVVDVDQMGGPAITLTFSGADAERIAAYTTTHVGGSVAFVLGDESLAAPVIQSPITDGALQLTFADDDRPTQARLREVTMTISSGPLPAPLREVPDG